MKNNIDINNIPKEKFELIGERDLHDVKFDTKPIGYFQDAWIRFRKNKASVFAACIILAILLFSSGIFVLEKYRYGADLYRFIECLNGLQIRFGRCGP